MRIVPRLIAPIAARARRAVIGALLACTAACASSSPLAPDTSLPDDAARPSDTSLPPDSPPRDPCVLSLDSIYAPHDTATGVGSTDACRILDSCACRTCRVARFAPADGESPHQRQALLDTGELVFWDSGATTLYGAAPRNSHLRVDYTLPIPHVLRCRRGITAATHGPELCAIDETGLVGCHGTAYREVYHVYVLLLPVVSAPLVPLTSFASQQWPGSGVCGLMRTGDLVCWQALRPIGGDFLITTAPPPEPPSSLHRVRRAWLLDRGSWGCAQTESEPNLVCWGLTWQRTPDEQTNGFVVPDTADAVTLVGGCILRARGDVACLDYDTRTAVPVAGLDNVVQLRPWSGGGYCATRRDGQVWCWGAVASFPTALDIPTISWPTPGRISPTRYPALEAVRDDATLGTCMVMRTGDVLDLQSSAPNESSWHVTAVGDAVEAMSSDGGCCVRRASGGVVCWDPPRDGADPTRSVPTAVPFLL